MKHDQPAAAPDLDHRVLRLLVAADDPVGTAGGGGTAEGAGRARGATGGADAARGGGLAGAAGGAEAAGDVGGAGAAWSVGGAGAVGRADAVEGAGAASGVGGAGAARGAGAVAGAGAARRAGWAGAAGGTDAASGGGGSWTVGGACGGVAAELAGDPALAARYRRLEAVWSRLELPPTAPVPLGFGGRVMAHVRELPPARGTRGRRGEPAGHDRAFGAGGFAWAAMPRWVRTTGAAAMVFGLVLGAGLGIRLPADERSGQAGEPALAECYWSLIGAPAATEDGGAAATPGGTESGANAAIGLGAGASAGAAGGAAGGVTGGAAGGANSITGADTAPGAAAAAGAAAADPSGAAAAEGSRQ
jgi:hypothetical protein